MGMHPMHEEPYELESKLRKGTYIGGFIREYDTVGVVEGDTGSLDYSLHGNNKL